MCLVGYLAYLAEYAAHDIPLRLLWQNGFVWRDKNILIAGKVNGKRGREIIDFFLFCFARTLSIDARHSLLLKLHIMEQSWLVNVPP